MTNQFFERYGQMLANVFENPAKEQVIPQLCDIETTISEGDDPERRAVTRYAPGSGNPLSMAFYPEHLEEPAAWLHELGHAYTLLLDSSVRPSPRAEVAAWAFVHKAAACAPAAVANQIRESIRRVKQLGPFQQKLDISFGLLVFHADPTAYPDRLISNALYGWIQDDA